MVHIVDGQVKSGHFPRGDSYSRRPTVFRVDKLPENPMVVPKNRFHLIVSAACPWAHRTILVRQLKDLRNIELSVVSPIRNDDVGWEFATEKDVETYGTTSLVAPTPDKASGNRFRYLHELYLKVDPKYTGNITTPVLYDNEQQTIVSNDSWDIIRYLDRAFLPGDSATVRSELYPAARAKEIDHIAKWVQDDLNNAVYLAGLARTQHAYEAAVEKVFTCLEKLEKDLDKSRYLVGDQISVADVQLYPTLARFDDVYFSLFKCSQRRLSSFWNLSNYVRDIHQLRGVSETLDEHQIKTHYYTTFTSANPNQVVPLGTATRAFLEPHDRAKLTRVDDTLEDGLDAVQESQADKQARVAKGEFVRGLSGFRRRITRDGSEEGTLPAEKGRYVLYIANNCPWCGRVAAARAILGLEDVIEMDVLFYRRDAERGWQFLPEDDQLREDERANRSWLLDGKVSVKDRVHGFRYIRDLYEMMGSDEKSVPVLFDRKTNSIVNNESAEIVRMMQEGFVDFHAPDAPNLYPAHLSQEIDELNAWIYQTINNGAYKAGFSSDQATYEKAFTAYFESLDRLDKMLATKRFLTGEKPTEADVRLFPTIVRHDPVYFGRMKLNKAMIRDYPHLNRWLFDMLSQRGMRESTNIDHCVYGYFGRTGNNLIPSLASRPQTWY